MEYDQSSPGQVQGLFDRIRASLGRLGRIQRYLLGLMVFFILCVVSGIIWYATVRMHAKAPLPPVTTHKPLPAVPAKVLAAPPVPPVQLAPAETADTRLMAPEEFKAGFESDLKDNHQPAVLAQKGLKPEKQVVEPGHAAHGASASRHASRKTDKKRKGQNIATLPQKPMVITVKYNDLMTAVICNDGDAVAQLLDLGWWVDKPDQTGLPPLLEAVKMGNVKMAEQLLKHRAEPNVRGGAALKMAKHNHDAAMEVLLLRYGAY